MIEVKIKLLRSGARVPKTANDGDVCVDLHACIDNPVRLAPGGVPIKILCGFAMELPNGYEGQVRSRSGLGKRGVVVVNSPGTIDTGFRGEVGVLLVNHGVLDHMIHPGDRVAQMAIRRAPAVRFHVTDNLSETVRGGGGFGSTGYGDHDRVGRGQVGQ
jgi:dUTP pyrophosphatase